MHLAVCALLHSAVSLVVELPMHHQLSRRMQGRYATLDWKCVQPQDAKVDEFNLSFVGCVRRVVS